MHISKLKLHNFKSFKDETILGNTSPQVNIIVGKNGSGKSNIIKAFSTIFDPARLSLSDRQALLNEGNVLSDIISSICIEIEGNDRFPFKETCFSIKRKVSIKSDEYSVLLDHMKEENANDEIDDTVKKEKNKNEQVMTKDEIIGIYESANLTYNSHFIIHQGKINELAVLSDNERLDLIKEIAGASIYEKDRKESIDLLNESEKNEERTMGILKSIEDRLKILERDQKIAVEYELFEKEKNAIEVAILEIEKNEIEDKINGIENKGEFIESDSCEDYDDDLEKISKIEKEVLRLEESFKTVNLINERYGIKNNIDFENAKRKTEIIDCEDKENMDENNKYKNKKRSTIIEIIEDAKRKSKKSNINIFKSESIIKNHLRNILKKNYNEKEKINNKIHSIKTRIKHLNKEESLASKENSINKIELDNFKIYFNKRDKINFEDEIKETKLKIEEKRKEYKEITTENQSFIEEENIDYFKKLESLIETRNKIWREEKKIATIQKDLLDDYITIERKMLYRGGFNPENYKKIKHIKGVHGMVFELLSISDELSRALETVAGSSLFNIVVDNEDIATELIPKLDNRVTFIPLNRMNIKEKEELELDDAISLVSQIKCDPIYKCILNNITKGAYLVSDVKTGVVISKTHNLNVVTLDGDFISKKGMVSGGFIKHVNILEEVKKKTKELKKIDKRKNEIKEELKKLENEINICKKMCETNTLKNTEKNYKESLKEIITFLERKLKMLIKDKDSKEKNKETFLMNGKKQLYMLECTKKNLELKIYNLQKENQTCENEIDMILLEKEKIDVHINKIEEDILKLEEAEKYQELKNELEYLKKKDEERKERENEIGFNDKLDFEKEKFKLNKKILMEKKINILRKIGTLGINKEDHSVYFNKELSNTINLHKKLKEINNKLKKLGTVNKRAGIQLSENLEKKEELAKRMSDLNEGRKRILEFIDELDKKKKDAINLTLSMLQNNFKYFFAKLSPGNKAELNLKNNGVEININGEQYNNLKNLSGGQKTLLALAFIFSIQKIDPSPFYFFDEIDANLDKSARQRVCELIKEICHGVDSINGEKTTQFFIATFREEMLEAGNKFFGVTFKDKNSYISEINKDAAMQFLSDNLKTENENN